ncbi:unnamed protein product [Ceratitis capitata]|uniref:(Mediterranean fruit fly) hypothetical protein n=1 Tax=Ceratitis capitata TaxID=7213 RepID=A0A811UNT6_CERCA|nr:unnamed protein product [Ceratitis capitata]
MEIINVLEKDELSVREIAKNYVMCIKNDLLLAIYARIHEGLDLAKDLDDFLQIDQNVCTEDNTIEIQFEEQNDVMDNSDSEEDYNQDKSEPITSYDEELKLVARLKQFAKNDFVSSFSIHQKYRGSFENEHFKLKQSIFKQSTITTFFQPK